MAGNSKRFEHFIGTAELSGLISIDTDSFCFLPKLKDEFDFDSIRMENLIAVYNNEVEPIKEVAVAIVDAYKNCIKNTQRQLADWAFDDEIISLAWDKLVFSKPRYEDINQQEKADADPSPFFLKAKKIRVLAFY